MVLGLLLLWKQTDFLLWIMRTAALLMLIGGAAQAAVWIFQKPRPKTGVLFLAVLGLALGGLLLFYPRIPEYLIPLLFSFYLLLNGMVKLVDAVLCLRNQKEEFFYSMIPAVFYLTFGGILLFSPRYHIRTVLIYVALYAILLGLTYILDFIRSLVPIRIRRGWRRKVRVMLPSFLTPFIPHSVLIRLNAFLSQGKKPDDFEDLVKKKSGEPPDLEIFIHVAADHFFMSIGHCDIWFDGELIAYGNYDEASQLPIGTGDGVLLISNKYQYLPFCLAFNHTTIFSFGLRLSEGQKEAIRARIREIKEQLVPWNPEENPKNRDIFAARYCREYEAACYKFSRGKFKTYFVMSTNCVLMADSIISRAGTDILNLNGIISPGALYDYLEGEFLKKDSMVITRNVYRLPLTEESLRQSTGA